MWARDLISQQCRWNEAEKPSPVIARENHFLSRSQQAKLFNNFACWTLIVNNVFFCVRLFNFYFSSNSHSRLCIQLFNTQKRQAARYSPLKVYSIGRDKARRGKSEFKLGSVRWRSARVKWMQNPASIRANI